MNGAGLSELLTTIYMETSVSHILSGKAVSRALWAHFFVHAALMSKLIDVVFPADTHQILLIYQTQLMQQRQMREKLLLVWKWSLPLWRMKLSFKILKELLKAGNSIVFQDNFHDVVQGYLAEKLEQFDIDEINDFL